MRAILKRRVQLWVISSQNSKQLRDGGTSQVEGLWEQHRQQPLHRIYATCSVQFSCSVVSDSLRPRGLQHARPPSPPPTPRACPNSCPLSQWCHLTIFSSVVSSPPVFSLSQHQGLFKWVSSSHQVAKILEFKLQHQAFQWTFSTDFL